MGPPTLAIAEQSLPSSVPRIVLEMTVSFVMLWMKSVLTKCVVGMSYASSLGECIESCTNTLGCVDVSFVNGSPGPCYMKSKAGDIVVNSNIWGGRQVSGCTTATHKLKLKLHRKRVVRKDHKSANQIQKRGIPYGPEFTYYAEQATTTTTSTVTQTAATT